MDLTTGVPFWLVRDGLTATYPKLNEDRRCDVAVIGGGITGAMVSQRFAEEGLHTVLLEGREMGYGSTGSSTALLQYELDTHLVDLAERIGTEAAQRCYRLCVEAVEGIGRLAEAIGAETDYRRRSSLYLASHRRDAKLLERERRARREIGIEVDLLSPSEIRSRYAFERPAALLSQVGGEVDPLRLTHALLAAGLRDGLEIYDRTGVAHYQSDRKGVLLETDDGWRIRAGKAVFATGCNIPPFFPRRAIRLYSSFVVATSPLSGFEGWGTITRWCGRRPGPTSTPAPPPTTVRSSAAPICRSRVPGSWRRRRTSRRRGSPPSSRSFFRTFASMWTGAGPAPSREPMTGCPISGWPRISPTATSRWATGQTAWSSPTSPPGCWWTSFTGRANPDAELFRVGR